MYSEYSSAELAIRRVTIFFVAYLNSLDIGSEFSLLTSCSGAVAVNSSSSVGTGSASFISAEIRFGSVHLKHSTQSKNYNSNLTQSTEQNQILLKTWTSALLQV